VNVINSKKSSNSVHGCVFGDSDKHIDLKMLAAITYERALCIYNVASNVTFDLWDS